MILHFRGFPAPLKRFIIYLRSALVKISPIEEKKFSEATRKLQIICPNRERSGVEVHVIVRNGCCYRSSHCMVFDCRYNRMQEELDSIISVIW